MPFPVLRSARVTLRGWEPRDAEPFAALNADPVAMQYFPSTLARPDSDALMARAQAALESRGWGLWCVDIGGSCAGFIGLGVPIFEAHFTPCVEIGWRVARPFWGRGFATEGARLALGFGFDELQLPEIVSFTAVGNIRSRRVMERLGMRRNPADDFDHPCLPSGAALCRHVLYRAGSPRLATVKPSK